MTSPLSCLLSSLLSPPLSLLSSLLLTRLHGHGAEWGGEASGLQELVVVKGLRVRLGAEAEEAEQEG